MAKKKKKQQESTSSGTATAPKFNVDASNKKADEIFASSSVTITDCATLVPTPSSPSNGVDSKIAQFKSNSAEAKKRVKELMQGKGEYNDNYPNGTQKSLTQTLVTTFNIRVHTKNGDKNVSITMNSILKDRMIAAMEDVFNNCFFNGEKFQVNSIGGYSHRCAKKPNGKCRSHLSNHSLGGAFDINPYDLGCPYYSTASEVGSDNSITKIRRGHPIIGILAKYGFGWGGDQYGDTMHFSYLGGH